MHSTEESDDVKIPLSLQIEILPSKWALKSLLEPASGKSSKALKDSCQINAKKLLDRYKGKIENPNDGKTVNIRVAREVFLNGCYTDNQLSTEYLSSLLVSSRTESGKDDSMIYYSGIMRDLSSSQLMLHYLIYRALNELLSMPQSNKKVNLRHGSDMPKIKIYISTLELELSGVNLSRDFVALRSKGLVNKSVLNPEFKPSSHMRGVRLIQDVIDSEITPTTLGFQLYGIACGRNDDWERVCKEVFNELPGISKLKLKSFSKENK